MNRFNQFLISVFVCLLIVVAVEGLIITRINKDTTKNTPIDITAVDAKNQDFIIRTYYFTLQFLSKRKDPVFTSGFITAKFLGTIDHFEFTDGENILLDLKPLTNPEEIAHMKFLKRELKSVKQNGQSITYQDLHLHDKIEVNMAFDYKTEDYSVDIVKL